MTWELRVPETLHPGAVPARDVSIVIPCYNEAAAVGTVLRELTAALPEAEVIAVDDGSTDATREALEAVPGIRVLVHDRNRGYGAAIKTSCKAATRGHVVWYDADGQHTPDMVREVLRALGGAECVIGARTQGSHASWTRRPGKWLLLRTARLLSGAPIVDLNSGLRGFRRSVLARYLHLLPDGFSASTTTTILMFERGYRVRWVPITTPARVGKSTVSIVRDGARVMMLILRLVNLFQPLRFYLPVSLSLVFLGLFYGVTRAVVSGRGIPVAAMLTMVFGAQAFFFGLVADQVSALRKERFETTSIDHATERGGAVTTAEPGAA